MKTSFYTRYQKQFLLDIPLAAYKSYDDSSKEMAIIIPHINALSCPENQEAYIHSSVAVRHSLVTNTDIVDRKIPVYFLVENMSYIDLSDLLMQRGVPEDRIRRFDSVSAVVKERRTTANFYMLKDEVLLGYKHLVKWDADLFACCDPRIGEGFPTGIFQTNRIAAQIFCNKEHSYDEIPAWWDRWDWTDENRTVKDNFEKTKSAVKELSGYEIKPHRFNKIVSTVLSYPMQQLPSNFLDFIFDIEPGAGSEELTLAIWCQCSGEKLDSIKLRFVPSWNRIEKARANGVYWAHFYIRRGDDSDHLHEKSLFYKDIGAV